MNNPAPVHGPGDLPAAMPMQPVLAANGVDTVVHRGTDLPPVLIAAAGGVLETLRAEYSQVKADKDAADKRYKEITDRMKLYALGALPGTNSLVIRDSAGYGPLGLSCHERVNFDRKRFNADHPEVDTKPYESATIVWTLRAVSG